MFYRQTTRMLPNSSPMFPLFRKLSSHIGHDITGNVTAEELVSFKEKHPVESIWAALQPPFSFSWYTASRFGDQAVVPLVSQSRNNLAL